MILLLMSVCLISLGVDAPLYAGRGGIGATTTGKPSWLMVPSYPEERRLWMNLHYTYSSQVQPLRHFHPS